MADSNNHFHKQTSREFSDDAIRQFLLARLDSEQQSAFEKSLFTDQNLEQRVRLAECELTDDYAFDRLTLPERTLFEQRFLVSTARKRQLTISEALRDRFDIAITSREITGNAFLERVKSVIANRRVAWGVAFAALLLLIMLGGVWLRGRKERELEREALTQPAERKPSAERTPVESHHPANQSMPEHQTNSSPMPEHNLTGQSPVSVALSPGVTRRQAPAITVPQSEESVVRFKLSLRTNRIQQYRAEVLNFERQTIFNGSASAPAIGGGIDFDVPAHLLKPGEFEIKLLDERANRTVATYYFRVH